MTHRNYHEIVARDPADCGRQLGRLFGSIVNGYVADASANPGWQRLKRNAAPLLEAAAGYFPDCIEELDAYAKTAGIPLIDLWTMSIEDELEEDDEYEKCTTIVTNGGRLIGHNEDWDEDSAEDICILKKTCGDITTLELYYYGSPLGGTAVSICSRGYIQAINSLHHSDMQVGVPKLILARRIAEIENAEVELPRILEIPRSSGFAHNLIDRTGKLTAIECTATRHAVHHPAMPFVHTNHFLNKSLSRFETGWDGKSTLRRYDMAMEQTFPAMRRQQLEQVMDEDTSGRTSSVFNVNTIAQVIVDLDERTASIWLRREQRKGWIDYPIEFLFTRPTTTS